MVVKKSSIHFPKKKPFKFLTKNMKMLDLFLVCKKYSTRFFFFNLLFNFLVSLICLKRASYSRKIMLKISTIHLLEGLPIVVWFTILYIVAPGMNLFVILKEFSKLKIISELAGYAAK